MWATIKGLLNRVLQEDVLPITTTAPGAQHLDTYLFPIIRSGEEDDVAATNAFQLYGLIVLRFLQVQQLNQITSDMHMGAKSDVETATLLLQHGKMSRAYMFCTAQIEELQKAVHQNRLPSAWGPYADQLTDLTVNAFDQQTYQDAQEAFRRAVAAGFDPKSVDFYYDTAVPPPVRSSANKRD